MAYRIVKDQRAWWPVEWKGVSEDGALVDNRIEMRFRLLKVDEAAAWLADVADAGRRELDEQDRAGMYARLVLRIADNWRGVEAENGDPLPWTADHVALLMNEGGLFSHVFDAFRDCQGARPKIHEGN